MTENFERALRWAAVCHEGQTRRGSDTPYFEHPAAVAMILDRVGFREAVLIAGLLHDVVEDTGATLDEVRDRFGEEVAAIVAHCSEVKRDAEGRKRPWIDRKRDHLAALAGAPDDARAVAIADKLHNLLSIACDLRDGRDVWSSFHADRESVLWYYRAAVDTVGRGTAALDLMAAECRQILAALETPHSSRLSEQRVGGRRPSEPPENP